MNWDNLGWGQFVLVRYICMWFGSDVHEVKCMALHCYILVKLASAWWCTSAWWRSCSGTWSHASAWLANAGESWLAVNFSIHQVASSLSVNAVLTMIFYCFIHRDWWIFALSIRHVQTTYGYKSIAAMICNIKFFNRAVRLRLSNRSIIELTSR